MVEVEGRYPCRDGDIGIDCCHEGEASVAYSTITSVCGNSDCATGYLIVDNYDGII